MPDVAYEIDTQRGPGIQLYSRDDLLPVLRRTFGAGVTPVPTELLAIVRPEAKALAVQLFGLTIRDRIQLPDGCGELLAIALPYTPTLRQPARAECDHPWHRNPGLIHPCPACGAKEHVV